MKKDKLISCKSLDLLTYFFRKSYCFRIDNMRGSIFRCFIVLCGYLYKLINSNKLFDKVKIHLKWVESQTHFSIFLNPTLVFYHLPIFKHLKYTFINMFSNINLWLLTAIFSHLLLYKLFFISVFRKTIYFWQSK